MTHLWRFQLHSYLAHPIPVCNGHKHKPNHAAKSTRNDAAERRWHIQSQNVLPTDTWAPQHNTTFPLSITSQTSLALSTHTLGRQASAVQWRECPTTSPHSRLMEKKDKPQSDSLAQWPEPLPGSLLISRLSCLFSSYVMGFTLSSSSLSKGGSTGGSWFAVVDIFRFDTLPVPRERLEPGDFCFLFFFGLRVSVRAPEDGAFTTALLGRDGMMGGGGTTSTVSFFKSTTSFFSFFFLFFVFVCLSRLSFIFSKCSFVRAASSSCVADNWNTKEGRKTWKLLAMTDTTSGY